MGIPPHFNHAFAKPPYIFIDTIKRCSLDGVMYRQRFIFHSRFTNPFIEIIKRTLFIRIRTESKAMKNAS